MAQSNVLIFGGIGGIGGALADQLVQEGSRVYVTTRDPGNAAPVHQNITVLGADVLNEESIRAAVQQSCAQGLSGLAYCVGSIDLKPFSRAKPEDLQKAFALNVIGAFIAVQEAASALAQSNGSVVLFSSIAAQRGFSNHSVIATAKAAIEGLTRSLAAELAPSVRVNAIAPSLTDTPLAKSMTQNAKIAESIAAMHPLPRLGRADEIAALAQFLLSDNSSWITGQILHVDGGRSTLERK